MKPQKKYELRRFVVKNEKLVDWNGVLIVVSYCYDISGGEDLSAVRQDVAVIWRPVTYMMSGVYISKGEMGGKRSGRDPKML